MVKIVRRGRNAFGEDMVYDRNGSSLNQVWRHGKWVAISEAETEKLKKVRKGFYITSDKEDAKRTGMAYHAAPEGLANLLKL